MHEFPNKPWSASGLDKLIKKIDNTAGTDCTNGSEPENWPPNSPDLNPVNTTFWKICHKECINIKVLGIYIT